MTGEAPVTTARDVNHDQKQDQMQVKTAYPELTGEVDMVGALLDTTRATRRCGCGG